MARKKVAAKRTVSKKIAKKSAKKKGVKKNAASKSAQPRKCDTYEEVSRHLLDMFSEDFGVDFFEGKQRLKGQRSGTKWQVDAKGVRTSDGAILVVECRRFTKAKQAQGKAAQLAYSISDLGAFGGIIVSPFDVQAGAKKIAKAENIQRVALHPDSTVESFHMDFIDKLKVVAAIPLVVFGGPPASDKSS